MAIRRDRWIASIRDSASLVDKYRAAPATRASSNPACSLGTVVAIAVTNTPVVTTSSPSVAIGLLRRRRALGSRRHRDLGLELEKILFADATYVHQLFDLLERAVLLPVLHDARGSLGADARQRLEIGGRCGVDVDDAGGRRCFGGATRRLRDDERRSGGQKRDDR